MSEMSAFFVCTTKTAQPRPHVFLVGYMLLNCEFLKEKKNNNNKKIKSYQQSILF